MCTKSGGLEVKLVFATYEEKYRRLGNIMACLKMNGNYEGLVDLNLEASLSVIVRYYNNRAGPTQALTGAESPVYLLAGSWPKDVAARR